MLVICCIGVHSLTEMGNTKFLSLGEPGKKTVWWTWKSVNGKPQRIQKIIYMIHDPSENSYSCNHFWFANNNYN